MYDAGHGERGRSKPDTRARGLRGPGRHGSGQESETQVRHGACLPLAKVLPPHTSSQPPACHGTYLVREERQRVGREGRGSGAWQVEAPTASPRAGEKVSSMPRRCTVCDHVERHSIDEALVAGAPYRSVAKRFERSEARSTATRPSTCR